MSGAGIREARETDADALALLIGQLGYDVMPARIAERLPRLAGPGRRVLVAESGGDLVGCLTTSMMQVLHRPAPVGRISMMVVAEGQRGKGIGAKLVREAEARLLADGCYMVEVTSNLARADAHRFYQGLGYAKTSVRLARELGSPISPAERPDLAER